ncbi:conjugal transfer protein TraF [Iodidimonas gelatinilytica]|uniref:conjugal transfer protein TraF n=1 Tax=Iodidimonas gelatinilytica TaxID=1236966 RepID=UPI001B2FF083|nr:conjugal transfer protein TraF [Iodidimonas gelatinilytica]
MYPISLMLCLLAVPAQASEQVGLIFVYRSDCAASRAFSTSLKAVTDHYRLAVLPVTLDDRRFAEWPGTVRDHGQAQTLGIERVPFLALFDPTTGALAPITSRYLPPAHLERRIAAAIEASHEQ